MMIVDGLCDNGGNDVPINIVSLQKIQGNIT